MMCLEGVEIANDTTLDTQTNGGALPQGGTQGLFDAISSRGNVTSGVTGASPAVDLADDRLNRAWRQLRYLVKGGPVTKQSKREDIYFNIIRSVHVSEAKLLMSVVGKKIPYKGLTRTLMLEVFPDWLPKSNELSE